MTAQIAQTARTPGAWEACEGNGVLDCAARHPTAAKVLVFSNDCWSHPVADCSCNHTCRMEDEQQANAAFIVQACNAHDDLVAALRETLAELEAYEAPRDPLDSHNVRVEQARAALAKAGAP